MLSSETSNSFVGFASRICIVARQYDARTYIRRFGAGDHFEGCLVCLKEVRSEVLTINTDL